MVELLVQRRERGLDLAEVHHPAQHGIERSSDMELDPERMPVHARALVPGRYVGQPMRGFEGEDLEDVHARPR